LLSSAALGSSAASAAPSGTQNYRLNVVGSDTIYCVDRGSTAPNTVSSGIMSRYTAAVAGSTGNQVIVTAPAGSINLGCTTTPATASVPSDIFHGKINYTTSGHPCAAPLHGVAMPWLFPFGSSAGITCYVDDQGHGDIAFTRSSRGPSTSKGDPSNLEFWAFALDAVTWVHMTANTHAPKSLTPAQLTAIYNCTDTMWGQVNGNAGDTTPISLYYPQVGSGTGDFFAQLFLGGNRPAPAASGCNSTIHFVPENDATQIAAGDAASALVPYSFAVRTAQANAKHIEKNLGAGTVLGNVNGAVPSVTTIKESAAFTNESGGNACTGAPHPGVFCGTRYVYHTVWSAATGSFGLAAPLYAAAIDVMGVPSSGTAGANSICSNKYSTVIRTFGFIPLPSATTHQADGRATTAVPGSSFCREF
jgi:ABC-type phosphate transport system substrate-binding protein